MIKRMLIAIALLVAALAVTVPSHGVSVCAEIDGRPVDTGMLCASASTSLEESPSASVSHSSFEEDEDQDDDD